MLYLYYDEEGNIVSTGRVKNNNCLLLDYEEENIDKLLTLKNFLKVDHGKILINRFEYQDPLYYIKLNEFSFHSDTVTYEERDATINFKVTIYKGPIFKLDVDRDNILNSNIKKVKDFELVNDNTFDGEVVKLSLDRGSLNKDNIMLNEKSTGRFKIKSPLENSKGFLKLFAISQKITPFTLMIDFKVNQF